MKQVVLMEPGRFGVRDVSEQETPSPGEVQVQVRRIGVCGTDLHAFAGRQPFFEYPRVLGHELGVEVVAVGDGVEGLSVGDRCAVEPYLSCGQCIACRRGRPNCCVNMQVLGVHVDGGMQPWLNLPADKLHRSTTLSLDQLALVETLSIGAHAIERAGEMRGETVLVIGAGPIGLGVMQFAHAAGAELIVADLSPHRLAFCRSVLPGVTTICPKDNDLFNSLQSLTNGDMPTCVIDATGHPGSMASTFELVAHGGRIVLVGLFQGELCFNDPTFHKKELTLLASRNATAETFHHVMVAVESGAVDTEPWVNRRMTLAEVPMIFPELHQQKDLLKAMIEVEAEA